ncbi:uncharacterized protein LOC131942747 [Physella acuta]|uniref:uncharacterized protein LOC131942747 n=1 Tax=Physella acuta TaxID=109671 RepID=UPI0027DD96C4|nr:uncharacterized protein LOC131942747 [Physella acuta]
MSIPGLADVPDVQKPYHIADYDEWKKYMQNKVPDLTGDPALYIPHQPASSHGSTKVQVEVYPPAQNGHVKDLVDIRSVSGTTSRGPSPRVTSSEHHPPGSPQSTNSQVELLERKISFSSETTESHVTRPEEDSLGRGKGDPNWILVTEVTSASNDNKSEKRRIVGLKKDEKESHYDSGVSFNYPDLEGNEETEQTYWDNFHTKQKVPAYADRTKSLGRKNKEIKFLQAYTPKVLSTSLQEGLEFGPLRWYHNETQEADRGFHGNNTSADGVKRRTPTPDYEESMASHASQHGYASNPNQQATNQNQNFQRATNIRRKGPVEGQRPQLSPTVPPQLPTKTYPPYVTGNINVHQNTNNQQVSSNFKPSLAPLAPNNPEIKSTATKKPQPNFDGDKTAVQRYPNSSNSQTFQPQLSNTANIEQKPVTKSTVHPNKNDNASNSNQQPKTQNNGEIKPAAETQTKTNTLKSNKHSIIVTDTDSKEIVYLEGEIKSTETPSNDNDSNSSGVDSIRSYSAEIGRVLSDLDEALESHGWQASIKKHNKQPRPLVAYV